MGDGWCRAIKFRAVNLAEPSTVIQVCISVCSGERYRTIMVLLFFMKAYVVGTHLNCIKNTDCNLKTMALLDCALIEVYAC